ncbi:MAG: hypothetical protein WKG06_06200 [Segetibacter sp.]
MKKFLLTTFIAVALISSAFASPVEEVNYFVINSFKDNFPKVTDVHWDVTSSYAKATFVLNSMKTEAFYKLNGDFIGTCYAITIDDLPVYAKRSFAKKYGSYIVKEAIKFDGNEETAYFISAENEKYSVVLKVDNSSISVYKVSSKN